MPTLRVGECRGSLEQNSKVSGMLRTCANMLTHGVVAKRGESLFYKGFPVRSSLLGHFASSTLETIEIRRQKRCRSTFISAFSLINVSNLRPR